jgi:signal peptidase I
MPATADPGPASTEPARPAESAEPARSGTTETGQRRRKRWQRRLAETVITLLAAALLSVGLRTYVYQTFWIPSASMVPTLAVYDRILVQKAFYGASDVREGDIVVFTHPPLDQCPGSQADDLIKRVIALPGQTVYSAGNSIFIDGHPLPERYLPAGDPLGPPIASREHPYRVPSGEFYVLGDNRADSCDSRYWGPIQGSTIVGKAVVIIWHNSRPDLHAL